MIKNYKWTDAGHTNQVALYFMSHKIMRRDVIVKFRILHCILVIESDYTGPTLKDGKTITETFVQELLQYLKDQKKLHKKYAYEVSNNMGLFFSTHLSYFLRDNYALSFSIHSCSSAGFVPIRWSSCVFWLGFYSRVPLLPPKGWFGQHSCLLATDT